MPRVLSLLIPVVAFIAVGVILPVGSVAWLLAHHQPPYVFDSARMGSPRTALGGEPVSLRPVWGVLEVIADGGTTATYADGSTATLVRAARPYQVIDKYGTSLPEKSSTSFSAGDYTMRDARLADGRVARTFGASGTVFAFVAPSSAALDRLIGQSAVRRNTKRDIGNAVLDDHRTLVLGLGLGWFLTAALLATLAIVRATKPLGQAATAESVTWPTR